MALLTRIQSIVLNAVSRPVPGASVAVLTQPANTTTQPGSPLASLFLDAAGTIPTSNPILTDGLGNYSFYVAPGVYTVQIYGNGIPAPIVMKDVQAPLVVVSSTASAGQFALGIDTNGNLIYGTPTVTTVSLPINAQTGTVYTVINGDQGKLVTLNNAAPIAVTLPQAGTSGQFPVSWFAYFENIGAGTATITPTISTIDGQASLVLAQNSGVLIASDGTNYFTMRGIGSTPSTANAFELTGSTGLPAATSTNLWIGGNFGTPHLGKIFIGDGTGWQIDFSKRVGSVTTDIFGFKDIGVLTFSSPSTGTLLAGISSPSTGIFCFGASGAANDSGAALRAATISQTSDNNVTSHARMTSSGVIVGSADQYLFSSTSASSGTPDTGFSRIAPGQVALGNISDGDFSGRLYQNISNANTTNTTVTGVTVQTTLSTVTTLTGELNAVGRWYTIRARGFYGGSATGTNTYKLAIGATNLITVGGFTNNTTANHAFCIEFDIFVTVAGASGSLNIQANSVIDNIGVNAWFTAADVTGIDVTGTVAFTFSVTPSLVGNSVTCRMMGGQRNN